MQLSSTSISAIKKLIIDTIKILKKNSEDSLVTDIYFYPNGNSGTLSIMDDEDHVLAQTEIEEWKDSDEDDDFYADIIQGLTEILSQHKEEGLFDDLNILKPYSFVLIDKDGESIEELLLMDDDLLIVNDSLLKNLDSELDEFLTHLLED